MFVGFLVFQLFSHQLIGLFNAKGSAEMYELGVPAFRAISWCFMPASFGILSSSVFQASGHGFLSLWGSLIRQFVGILPMALFFARTFGLYMVWWSFPLAEIMGTLYFALMLHHMYNKEFRRSSLLSVYGCFSLPTGRRSRWASLLPPGSWSRGRPCRG